jgi:hypothetical protein
MAIESSYVAFLGGVEVSHLSRPNGVIVKLLHARGHRGRSVSDGVRAPGRDEAAVSIRPSDSELGFVKGRPGSVTVLHHVACAQPAARWKIETP